MEATFWAKLSVSKTRHGWVNNGITATKGKPATKADEVAIRVSIVIPDAYFETPELSARIEIPADQVGKTVITPSITQNIGEVIASQLGVKVHLSSEIPEGE